MNWCELLMGKIPEAIFCALFIIVNKEIKEKRFIFTILMIVEYLLLKYALPYNSWFQVLYVVLTYLTLKIIYKDKSQITDIFIMVLAYIVIVITGALCYYLFIKNFNVIIANAINKFIMFLILFIIYKKNLTVQKIYKKLWNKSDKKHKIKSTTFRSINLVLLNIIFVIINLGMAYAIYINNIR